MVNLRGKQRDSAILLADPIMNQHIKWRTKSNDAYVFIEEIMRFHDVA